MPAAGLEPARCCQQQILSLPRLPFRHAGASLLTGIYHNTIKNVLQVFFVQNIREIMSTFRRKDVCYARYLL